MPEAARIVNENISAIEGTLRAAGSVDGQFVQPDGRRRSYHLDGVLFFLSPRFVRFDMKSFGETQLLFGSNMDRYWFFNGQDESYVCGRHDQPNDSGDELPARPDQIVDALGLTPIPLDEWGRSTAPRIRLIQRIVDDSQQLLFLIPDSEGRVLIEKEYWLDRFPPRLVRRVLFRDADGAVEMDSTLGDYRSISPDGALLAHVMDATWPRQGAKMRFEVRKWSQVPQIGPGAPQFATPPGCANNPGFSANP